MSNSTALRFTLIRAPSMIKPRPIASSNFWGSSRSQTRDSEAPVLQQPSPLVGPTPTRRPLPPAARTRSVAGYPTVNLSALELEAMFSGLDSTTLGWHRRSRDGEIAPWSELKTRRLRIQSCTRREPSVITELKLVQTYSPQCTLKRIRMFSSRHPSLNPHTYRGFEPR